VRAFFCDGTFHKEHQEAKRGGKDPEGKEAVEISECGWLLLTLIIEGLQRRLVSGDRIAGDVNSYVPFIALRVIGSWCGMGHVGRDIRGSF
jgi:hypothetical protein